MGPLSQSADIASGYLCGEGKTCWVDMRQACEISFLYHHCTGAPTFTLKQAKDCEGTEAIDLGITCAAVKVGPDLCQRDDEAVAEEGNDYGANGDYWQSAGASVEDPIAVLDMSKAPDGQMIAEIRVNGCLEDGYCYVCLEVGSPGDQSAVLVYIDRKHKGEHCSSAVCAPSE